MDKELKRRLIRHLEAACRHYTHIIMMNDRATTAADALLDAKQLIAHLKGDNA